MVGNRRRRTQRWAFVDESLRANRYLMAAVIADAADLAHLRARLRAGRVGGRSRIHFHSETDQRRRQLLDLYATLPITVIAVTARRARGQTEHAARRAVLSTLVARLQDQAVAQLIVESRQDDSDDQRTITTARQTEPYLGFDHVRGVDEPCLWLADGCAWALTAGGLWARRLQTLAVEIETAEL